MDKVLLKLSGALENMVCQVGRTVAHLVLCVQLQRMHVVQVV